MADTVTSTIYTSGPNQSSGIFTNISDGTGESAVTKIDISALPGAPTAVKILKVGYSCFGMSVKIAFDHTADDTALVVGGNGVMDLEDLTNLGFNDPQSTGGTGDIVFSTLNASANDSYTVAITVEY